MAISWKFNISQIGTSGNYNISAEVTDDTLPAESQTEKVSIQGRLDTEGQKNAAISTLNSMYQEKVANTSVKDALDLEMKTLAEK